MLTGGNFAYSMYENDYGRSINVGVTQSYLLTNRLRFNAEINYSHRWLDVQGDAYAGNVYDSYGLNIPLTAMLNISKPQPFSLYMEIGIQPEYIIDYDIVVGAIAGIGATFYVRKITAYLGYRIGYGSIDDMLQSSIGLRVLY